MSYCSYCGRPLSGVTSMGTATKTQIIKHRSKCKEYNARKGDTAKGRS